MMGIAMKPENRYRDLHCTKVHLQSLVVLLVGCIIGCFIKVTHYVVGQLEFLRFTRYHVTIEQFSTQRFVTLDLLNKSIYHGRGICRNNGNQRGGGANPPLRPVYVRVTKIGVYVRVLKSLGVIHERYTQTDRACRSKTQIHL
jgi:hypothetical protein